MKKIHFSVSMCVYEKDNPEWFTTAVESVLNQTIQPDEIVLVVDGPIPKALDRIINKYETLLCFKVIRLDENQGHGNARRIGIENCSNDLIALMDADDICVKDRFEKQLKVFNNDSNLDIVGGNISEFIEEPKKSVGYRNVQVEDSLIKQDLKQRCPMNQVTVMLKKQSILSVGGYIDWYCNEDYYLWVRMFLADMKFANVDHILVNVRVGSGMYQRRGGWAYFSSEYRLQKYMYQNQIIGIGTFFRNSTKRFIVQMLMPNKIRGWVFRKYARTQG